MSRSGGIRGGMKSPNLFGLDGGGAGLDGDAAAVDGVTTGVGAGAVGLAHGAATAPSRATGTVPVPDELGRGGEFGAGTDGMPPLPAGCGSSACGRGKRQKSPFSKDSSRSPRSQVAYKQLRSTAADVDVDVTLPPPQSPSLPPTRGERGGQTQLTLGLSSPDLRMPPPYDLGEASVISSASHSLNSHLRRALEVRIHPAVVTNTSVHLNRVKDKAACNQEGFGILFGVQREQKVDVVGSVEVAVHPNSGARDIFNSLYNAVKSSKFWTPGDIEFLGWYYIGRDVQDIHIRIHMEVIKYLSGRAIYVLFHAAKGFSQKEFPMAIYELSTSMYSDESPRFIRLCFITEIVEAKERKTASDLISLPGGKGEGANCKHRFFQTMLLETPSGFAMFHISERVFNYPESIWAWFTHPADMKDVICTLGFIKVENKSVVRKSDVGPGQDLEQFIKQRLSYRKELIVPDQQFKYVIEKNIGIACCCIPSIVHELTWGLNYVLEVLIPEEKGNCVFPWPMSRGLEKKIRAYGFNISPHMIDRKFINMIGYLNYLDFTFETASLLLHHKFGNKSFEAIKKEIAKDGECNSQEIRESISIISSFPDKRKAVISSLKRIEIAAVDDTDQATNQDTKQALDQAVGGNGPLVATFFVGFGIIVVTSFMKKM